MLPVPGGNEVGRQPPRGVLQFKGMSVRCAVGQTCEQAQVEPSATSAEDDYKGEVIRRQRAVGPGRGADKAIKGVSSALKPRFSTSPFPHPRRYYIHSQSLTLCE